MSPNNQAHKVYLQQQVMTASPAKLVQMLYDHAIDSLKEAIKAIEENDIERRWKSTSKASEIITHLWTTLDMEGGGDISKNLDQLFAFMIMKLPEVDFKNNPEPARHVITLLEPLRNAWKELADKMSEQEMAQALADARNQQPQPTESSAQPSPAAPSAPAPQAASPAQPQQPVPPTYPGPKGGYGSAPAPQQGVSVSA